MQKFRTLMVSALLTCFVMPLSAQLKIDFKTKPPIATIGPDETVAKMVFSLTKDSQPIDGVISITFEMDYLFPIRGEYSMKVTALVNDKKSSEIINFSLNENPHEVSKFIFLTLGLLIFGLLSGLVIGRGATLKAKTSEEIENLTNEAVKA